MINGINEPINDNCRLLIRNIPKDVSEKDVHSLFNQFGKNKDC